MAVCHGRGQRQERPRVSGRGVIGRVADLRAEKRKLTQLDIVGRGGVVPSRRADAGAAEVAAGAASGPALALTVALPVVVGSNWAEFAHLITQNGCVVEAEPANVVGRCAVPRC